MLGLHATRVTVAPLKVLWPSSSGKQMGLNVSEPESIVGVIFKTATPITWLR